LESSLHERPYYARTIAKIWNRWVSTRGIPIIFGCKIIFNQSDIEEICNAEISIGQKEFLHMTLEIGQEENKWNKVSLEWEQREQDVSNPKCMDKEIRDFVGIVFQTIFQRKSLSRWLSLSFHRPFQLVGNTGESWRGLWVV
jgi:hypothetical protein